MPIDLDPATNQRIDHLLGAMTPDEKIEELMADAPGVPRLDFPRHNWWNEALHGVARAGVATVFPQSIGLGATFAPAMLHKVGEAIALEGRAKHHAHAAIGDRGIYKGLTYWSPNINIYRDPRWGRGHETYGEDPHLTARLGCAFVQGVQGPDPRRLRAAACAKHFAVHSGPEAGRGDFDSQVSARDLRETYLPAFGALVREAGVAGVMSAYNAINGTPCTANRWLLTDLLRGEWGFDGYVTSDCGAVDNIWRYHKTAPDLAAAIVQALRAGMDVSCGCARDGLRKALANGGIGASELDRPLRNLLRVRARLGLLDPAGWPAMDPGLAVIGQAAHRQLALETARASMVLGKNDGILPLPAVRRIAVVGPNARNLDVLLGNYAGTPAEPILPVDGIRALARERGIAVTYAEGCQLTEPGAGLHREPDMEAYEAALAARDADLVVACLGMSPRIEGEAGDATNPDGSEGDRIRLTLPPPQRRLLKRLVETGKPVVLVLFHGGAMDLRWEMENCRAVISAWYPGEAGGLALAELLFGVHDFSGRLPVSFPRQVEDLPHFHDYGMEGRTYRFARAAPLLPFGFGLSYTTFAYAAPQAVAEADGGVSIAATVTNTGRRAGRETVQCYATDCEASDRVPVRSLRGIEQIDLAPGESRRVSFRLGQRDLCLIDRDGQAVFEPGAFRLSVGGRQPDAVSAALGATSGCVETVITLGGERRVLAW